MNSTTRGEFSKALDLDSLMKAYQTPSGAKEAKYDENKFIVENDLYSLVFGGHSNVNGNHHLFFVLLWTEGC
jgi:hypothetical protein